MRVSLRKCTNRTIVVRWFYLSLCAKDLWHLLYLIPCRNPELRSSDGTTCTSVITERRKK